MRPVGSAVCVAPLRAGSPKGTDSSRSLLPLLRGERSEHHRTVLAEADGDDGLPRGWGGLRPSRIRRRLMVRDHTHKLVTSQGGRALKLFDLERDPHEEHNLLGRSDAAEHEARLRGELERFRKEKPAIL